MKLILCTAAVAVAGYLAWPHLEPMVRTPAAAPAKEIVFDNGTVREPRVTLPIPREQAMGTLKRCEGPAGTLYTDGACPRGSRAKPVQGTMSVVEGGVPPAPAPARTGSALREALNPAGEPTLRELHMERITGR